MPYQVSPPMTPSSLYFAVVWSDGASLSAQPYSSTASEMSVIRPVLARKPAVALPLLNSMRSGAASESSTWLAVFWICSKDFSSNSTVAPVSSSKIVMASAQALPIALSAPS